MKTLRRLWQHNRLLLVSFVLATAITLGFIIRISYGLIYWANYAQAPLEKWMPIGYVARSYDVDRQVLVEGLGLPRDSGAIRLSLAEVAKQTGIPYEALEVEIYRLINEANSPAISE